MIKEAINVPLPPQLKFLGVEHAQHKVIVTIIYFHYSTHLQVAFVSTRIFT